MDSIAYAKAFAHPHKKRQTHAIEADAKVFRLRAQLCQYVLKELGLQDEYVAQLVVVEATRLVQLRQLLAQRYALLPALALVKVLEYLQGVYRGSL